MRGDQFPGLTRDPDGVVRHALQVVSGHTQGLESTYGAAGSIVILLIWVHYSAQIVLFGAELTHAYATETGARRTTDVNAELPHKATA